MRHAEAETIALVPTTTPAGTIHRGIAYLTLALRCLETTGAVHARDATVVAIRKAKAALEAAER